MIAWPGQLVFHAPRISARSSVVKTDSHLMAKSARGPRWTIGEPFNRVPSLGRVGIDAAVYDATVFDAEQDAVLVFHEPTVFWLGASEDRDQHIAPCIEHVDHIVIEV